MRHVDAGVVEKQRGDHVFTLPTPAEPKLSFPGRARASAISARRLFRFA